jgi:hypothetical protein
MQIFYSESAGRNNVPAKNPVEQTVESTLNVFRDLNQKTGFLGVILDTQFVLQLLPNKNGVRIELLDSSKPSIDSCETDIDTAEEFIKAANNMNVLSFARQTIPSWRHLKL